MRQLSESQSRISWTARVVVAGILLQTLFFKFTGAAESVYIFEQLGAEPWGRIGSGVAELVAGVLLLVPATAAIGAVIALVIILGAIVSHLTVLGFEVQADGGTLFILACVVLLGAALVAYLHRHEIPIVGTKLG